MRIATISAAALAVWSFSLLPAHAGQRGNGAGRTTTTHAPNTHAQASHSAGPKTTTHGNPHTSTGSTTRSTSSKRAATTPSTTVNPIAQKLQGKPLGNRIQKMLPAGMTLNQASSGFKNQGQFIAAVHVSRNLGIPFADLKATMLGTPTSGTTASASSPMSLGQAIQKLRPTADSTTAVKLAEREADADIRQTSTTTTSSKKKTTTTNK